MSNPYASGRNAIAECDVCGFRYKLTALKKLVVKGKLINVLACPACWVPDQPQLMLGEFPVDDPQAIRNPRPDNSYYLQDGSRRIEWGWAPVGGASSIDSGLTPNSLFTTTATGTVTVVIT